ncbi:MAG: hypothetical protein IJ868_00480 [Prevotella sp.]|nr:hypothetical protein [Prevotella sp.]
MDKLRLRALAVILKKLSKVAELKFATKSELKVYQNPHFVGDTLTFPAQNAAHFDGDTLVLTE